MLEARNITVSVKGKRILKNVNLEVKTGEVVVLFGPNGSGKTSLLNTIIGIPDYRVESGGIFFKGEDITGYPIDVRASLGLGVAFQRPPAVRGVRLRELLRMCIEKRGEPAEDTWIEGLFEKLNLLEFQERDVNLGFSGGEIKRSELIQLLAQEPEFVMLDEPDSGVDLVSVDLVGSVINQLLEKDRTASRRTKAGMLITHAGHILDYVNADRAYVMLDGSLYCRGNPRDILNDIRDRGYEGCLACQR
jgi:Fe-S cluster assembly ATP-binding protein